MKVVNVSNGDYKLVVQSGGEITLNTGSQAGLVRITGDLLVEGNTTTVQSETMTVKDNIIIVNAGETGNGVSLTNSGITVDRGNYADASWLFDESVSHYDANGASVAGTFTFRNDTNALIGIQTCSINTRGENLYLINAPGTGVVTVIGTADYERNIFDYAQFELDPPEGPIEIIDPDALPNAQALKDYVDTTLAFFDDYAISEDDTGIECIKAAPGPYNYYRTLLYPDGSPYVGPADSKITFTVDGDLHGKFTVSGLDVDRVNIFEDTVKNTTNNLILTSDAAAKIVEVDAVLQLNDTGLGPTALTGVTKIYTQDSDTTPAPGKTGIYFTSLGNSDELVAKNRALLFSILF